MPIKQKKMPTASAIEVSIMVKYFYQVDLPVAAFKNLHQPFKNCSITILLKKYLLFNRIVLN